MKKFFYLLPLLFLTIFLWEDRSHSTGNEKEIIWVKSHYPPYYITKGADAGMGIADGVEKLLQEELTEYTHISMEANWKRVMQLMKSGQNVVNLTLLKTSDRKSFIEYSTLTSIKPTNGVCVRSDETIFKDSTDISFNTLLKMEGLKIGILHGRSYGKGIDDILKEKKNHENIYIRSAPDGVEGLMKLLLIGRIDALVCYPHESTWLASQQGFKDKIKQLRVVEQEPINFSYSGAPKTEWGKKIITEINAIYKKHNILQKTTIALEPYLDTNTLNWFRNESKKIIEDNQSEEGFSKQLS